MQKQRRRLLWALTFLPLVVTLFPLEQVNAGDDATITRHGMQFGQDNAVDYKLYCVSVLQGDFEAAYQLGWMRFSGRKVPADNALAAGWFQLAAKHGESHSQRILDDLLPGVEPVVDDACPLRHGEMGRTTIETWIKVLAPSYGLDANLLLAVVEVESRFNPHARSLKNARGLMQLMPETARRYKVKDIWDPFENLKAGMEYLRWLIDYYKGDLDLSLAAYNAGEQIVDRYGGIPPYRETRDYVKSVNRIYNRLIP